MAKSKRQTFESMINDVHTYSEEIELRLHEVGKWLAAAHGETLINTRFEALESMEAPLIIETEKKVDSHVKSVRVEYALPASALDMSKEAFLEMFAG